MALTEKRIRDAKPGESTRVEWDGEVKGLGLRITPAGAKAFVLDYRIDGRKRRMTIGRPEHMKLAKAREVAGDLLSGVRLGRDPLAEREARKTLPTVAEGWARYEMDHAPKRIAKGRMTERTCGNTPASTGGTSRPSSETSASWT